MSQTFFYPHGFIGPENASAQPYHLGATSGIGEEPDSADQLVINYLPQLQAAGRQMERRGPLSAGFFRTAEESIVGTGIHLQSQAAAAERQVIEELWTEWGDDCEVSGLSWWETLRQVCRELLIVGEAFVVVRPGMQLQLLEAEWVRVDFAPSDRWRCGMELNEFRRPLAYAVQPIATRPATIVPADEMLHIYWRSRPAMLRGIPRLHAVSETLEGLARYERTETIRADVASSLIGTIEEPEATEDIDVRPPEETVEPGRFRRLFGGETLNLNRSDSPNLGFKPFTESLAETIAAGAGMAYETLTSDYSRSNYSSSRLSQTRERDHWRTLQKLLIQRFCRPVFRRWAAANGVDPAHLWQARGWPTVDPSKDLRAQIDGISAGITTLTNVCAEGGTDFEELMQQRRRELDLLKQLQIPVTTTPGSVTSNADADPDANPDDSGPDDSGSDEPDQSDNDDDDGTAPSDS